MFYIFIQISNWKVTPQQLFMSHDWAINHNNNKPGELAHFWVFNQNGEKWGKHIIYLRSSNVLLLLKNCWDLISDYENIICEHCEAINLQCPRKRGGREQAQRVYLPFFLTQLWVSNFHLCLPNSFQKLLLIMWIQ